MYGEEAIDVYHQQFKPLELTLPGRGDNASYVKVIVNKQVPPNKTLHLPRAVSATACALPYASNPKTINPHPTPSPASNKPPTVPTRTEGLHKLDLSVRMRPCLG